ncbi:MAG TPA: biotin carboxylase N-terminal domain-containing protein [Acetobacteraceae bacterium]
MFGTLLIANRGEIACRIVRTARRMGVRTVAVYSDADAGALHVQMADEAVAIGAAPAPDSYLNIPRIIDAARRSGADSVHPGYGFLSENPAFAEACAAAGLIFVGPPASAMRALGSKSAAKQLMAASGVPILPGYHGDDQDPERLAAAARGIGFPVVIKAVAGGGGRGMRVVSDPSGFAAALASARQEASSAFGDDRVLVERYLQCPRHIEVQVFADKHGNAVHLFERDCSTQRRHQKVIEEAPAPGLDAARRAAMGSAAVAAAKAAGYEGAGTVEFVADADAFWFLEMNTRLQVEHPVTEMITGFDLVEWQLRIAAGEPIPVPQEAIRLDGHAIEARLYAEDTTRDFAPSIGELAALRLPTEQDGVRVDTGVRQGDRVSIHYDAMIAKLICHGATRPEAIRKLRKALNESFIAGVASNLDLLGRIAAHPVFAAGEVDTGFVARHAEELLGTPERPPAEVLATAALTILLDEQAGAAKQAAESADPYSPWHVHDGWWLNASPERSLTFVADAADYPIGLRRSGAAWRLVVGDRVLRCTASRRADGLLAIELDGVRHNVPAAQLGDRVVVRWGGTTWRLALPNPAAAAELADMASAGLPAPIPGQVTAVNAVAGQSVRRGEVLIVLEAMKTVFRLSAPADAVVAEVTCHPGETVEEGQVLIRFMEPDATQT